MEQVLYRGYEVIAIGNLDGTYLVTVLRDGKRIWCDTHATSIDDGLAHVDLLKRRER